MRVCVIALGNLSLEITLLGFEKLQKSQTTFSPQRNSDIPKNAS